MSKFRETTVHGNASFPIAFYRIEKSHPRYIMNFHWHPEFEIIRIVSGTIELHLGEEVFSAHAGEVYFLPGGMTHMGMPEDCVYECIVFRLEAFFLQNDLCLDELEPLLSQKLSPRNPIVQTERLRTIVAELFEVAGTAQTECRALLVKGGLLRFFGDIMSRKDEIFSELTPDGLELERERYYTVKKVIKHIQSHCTERITLSDLSEVAGMSPNYFCRFFKRLTGLSPIEYLISCRIELAAYQLREEGLSVTDIALSCGFDDISHFINTFRKHKGMTPLKYRMSLGKA